MGTFKKALAKRQALLQIGQNIGNPLCPNTKYSIPMDVCPIVFLDLGLSRL